MSFIWSIDAIMVLIATFEMVIAEVLVIYFYNKRNYYHLKYYIYAFLFGIIADVLQFLSYGYQIKILYMIHNHFIWLMMYFFILLIDSFSKDDIGHNKILFMAIVYGAFSIISLKPESVEETINMYGQMSYKIAGIDIQLFSLLWFVLVGVLWLNFSILLIRYAPKSSRRAAIQQMIGMIFLGPVTILVEQIGITVFLPELNMVTLAFGLIIIVIIHIKNPELAYIIPFKVSRLSVLDSSSGIPLFTFRWIGIKDDNTTSDVLFSGMIQGINGIISESVNKGKIQEIRLSEGIMILNESSKYSILSVLITNKSNKILRLSLKKFSENFDEWFGPQLHMDLDMNRYNKAEELIAKYFPFIPVE